MQTDAEVAAIARQMSIKMRQIVVETRAGQQRPYTDIPRTIRRRLFSTDTVVYVPGSEPARFCLSEIGLRVAQHLKQENAKP